MNVLGQSLPSKLVWRRSTRPRPLRPSAHKVDSAAAERAVTFAVDLHCEGCVKAVRRGLQGVAGISSLEVDLASQSVRVNGSASTESLLAILTAGGRHARVTGQGSLVGFDAALASSLGLDERTLRQSLAAVAEFKGPAWRQGTVVGVVRFVQLDGTATRVEGVLEGLPPGRHTLAVHSYGDLTDGAASTGAPLAGGLVASLVADAAGRAELVDCQLSPSVQVWDIIGRALVLPELGVAAVVARSASAGDNDKKICACDGTIIWHAGDIQPDAPRS